MVRPLTRIEPAAGPELFKTYSIAAPVQTHFRDATCDEVGCQAFLNGWRTRPRTADEADYVRTLAGRQFQFLEVVEDGEPVFYFEAGQQCFKPHKVRLDREELFAVRHGDHRKGFGPATRFGSAAEFVDDFGAHQEQLARR